jgi:hypothetical protein
MTTPTPAPVPDPNNTNLADENEENPAFNENANFEAEQGIDPENVSPTQDATKDEEPVTEEPFNTDTGQSGV